MAEMTVAEATNVLHKNPKVLSYSERLQIAALIEQQAQEIERMNKSLKFEQNYLSRVGTHAEGCYKWGPGHWDCAMQEIERLANNVNNMAIMSDNHVKMIYEYKERRDAEIAKKDRMIERIIPIISRGCCDFKDCKETTIACDDCWREWLESEAEGTND